MTVGALRGITVDVSDLDRGAAFWGHIFGVGTRHRQDGYLWLEEIAPGIQLILQEVADEKVAKNRVHLDVVTTDPEALVSSVESLGGVRIGHVDEDDYSLIVMADPDRNEFCVLDRLSPGLTSRLEMPRLEEERR